MLKKSRIREVVDRSESRLFSRLNSPAKIQDFLNSLPFNHEQRGETYMSPRRALKAGTMHCFEGALFAAAVLAYHGQKPLLMDLRSAKGDQDHVVTLFKKGKFWGALSKTNHNVLRYREPIYANIRELALSYFHEYFLADGRKMLRAYSDPFDLSNWNEDWFAAEYDLVDLVNALDDSKHYLIVPRGLKLRRADAIERDTYDALEWPKTKRSK